MWIYYTKHLFALQETASGKNIQTKVRSSSRDGCGKDAPTQTRSRSAQDAVDTKLLHRDKSLGLVKYQRLSMVCLCGILSHFRLLLTRAHYLLASVFASAVVCRSGIKVSGHRKETGIHKQTVERRRLLVNSSRRRRMSLAPLRLDQARAGLR